jgi:hypothetical protein
MARERERVPGDASVRFGAQEWISAVMILVGLFVAACAVFGTAYWFVTTP